MVSAAAETRQSCGCCGGDQPVEPALELGGALGGIGEAVRVGPQPSAHGSGALEGPAGAFFAMPPVF